MAVPQTLNLLHVGSNPASPTIAEWRNAAAQVLETCVERRVGSSPTLATKV